LKHPTKPLQKDRNQNGCKALEVANSYQTNWVELPEQYHIDI